MSKQGIAARSLRRITPGSARGRAIAAELGVKWSPRANTAPIDGEAHFRMAYATCTPYDSDARRKVDVAYRRQRGGFKR